MLSSTTEYDEKNPLALLNELRTNLIYNLVSKSGPDHGPTFTISVVVDREEYFGCGRSKKDACKNAASKALQKIMAARNEKANTIINGLTSSKTTRESNNINLCDDFTVNTADILWVNRFEKITKCAISPSNQITTEKCPVALLYELFLVTFDCTEIHGPNQHNFKTIATINGTKQFEGIGSSKKLSKNAAAKAALASLCNITYNPFTAPMIKNYVEFEQTVADFIGNLVLSKYDNLMSGTKYEAYRRRKTLAGIVLTFGGDLRTAQVITVCTGTKCINGEYMSENGLVVNDSHAEILARRCFMTFLYDQLEIHSNLETASMSVFEKPSNGSRLYRLKENIQVHLYISTAPCGDARVFSPHENDLVRDKHPNRKARGLLRVKIESGEGTIPVKNCNSIQCWDGILIGQRLLTMSCSDKIARWNVLGLQGALLSSIIEPIYLHSITLGSLLHPSHMYRAIGGRLERTIGVLPPNFCLSIPKLALLTTTESRCPLKSPNYSVNWTHGYKNVEVINSFTGKTICNKPSRLAKQNMFTRYERLAAKLHPSRNVNGDYEDKKSNALDYQEAKRMLFAAFRRESLGNWIKKPLEQDQFPLEHYRCY